MNDRQDERRMLADSVAGFARAESTITRVRTLTAAGKSFSPAVWDELAELGWLGILVTEEAGGLGLGVPEMAVVAEGLGRARTPEPFTAVAGLAAGVLAAGDKQGVCHDLLQALAAGKRLVAVAWQEDRAEPAYTQPATRVDNTASGRVLSGHKYLAVPAEADLFIVSALTPDGLALFGVPAGASGLDVTVRTQMDGCRVADLRLDGVAVGDDDLVASAAVGEQALARGLAYAEIIASAELLGLADSLLGMTTEYLGNRTQFDQPLTGFQVLRHRLVNLYIQTELMRAALRHATGVAEAGCDLVDLQRAASRVKARCSDAAMTIARDAVQLHGAIGYTEEANVGVYMHRILTLNAWLGNAAWHRRRYAELTRDIEETT